jgi:hypothetical protein
VITPPGLEKERCLQHARTSGDRRSTLALGPPATAGAADALAVALWLADQGLTLTGDVPEPPAEPYDPDVIY